MVAIAITLMTLAEPAEARRANMPDGWKWPPTREMRREGKKCLDDLRAMGVKFEKARKKRNVTTPIVVPDMRFGSLLLTPTFRKPPFVMDCRLARGIAQYAELITSLGVSELRFSTIYQYRKVRTRRSRRSRGALSRHALGLAIDVFEIQLATGARVVVKDEYWLHPTLVLIELALRATGGFRAIISPAVDPVSHRDHLHLEIAVEYPEEARKEAEKKEKLRQKRLAAKRRKLRAERKRLRAERKKRKKRGAQAEEATLSATAPADPAEVPEAPEPADETEGAEDETNAP